MNDLEARLTADLAAAARRADLARPERDTILTTVSRRRRRRRARYAGGLGAAIIALGIVGLQTTGRDGDQVRTDEPVETTDSSVPETTPETPPRSVTTAPTTTSTTTSAQTPADEGLALDQLVLRGDGLGSAAFGDPMDDVLPVLVARLGPPQNDTGRQDLSDVCSGSTCQFEVEPDPECHPVGSPHLIEQTLRWQGLMVTFRGAADQPLQMRAWQAFGSSELTTLEGVQLSDPLDVWQSTYPQATFLRFQEATDGTWADSVTIPLPGGDAHGFTELGAPPMRLASLEVGTTCVMEQDV